MQASASRERDRAVCEYVVFVTRCYYDCISGIARLSRRILHHPLTPYLLLYWVLRYYLSVASAGSVHTQRRRSRVIYDYAGEHDKPRRGGQKVDTTGEGYASRRPVLSWIDRYIDALSRSESVDLSSPIVFGASGELMGRLRSVYERD